MKEIEARMKNNFTKYLTIDELASILQVPKSWIYMCTSEKKIPHTHVGKYLRFDMQKINEWLENPSIDRRSLAIKSNYAKRRL